MEIHLIQVGIYIFGKDLYLIHELVDYFFHKKKS